MYRISVACYCEVTHSPDSIFIFLNSTPSPLISTKLVCLHHSLRKQGQLGMEASSQLLYNNVTKLHKYFKSNPIL